MKRAGKLLQEWLLERGVSSVETVSGEYEDCMLFSDPRPLGLGKGPWHASTRARTSRVAYEKEVAVVGAYGGAFSTARISSRSCTHFREGTSCTIAKWDRKTTAPRPSSAPQTSRWDLGAVCTLYQKLWNGPSSRTRPTASSVTALCQSGG